VIVDPTDLAKVRQALQNVLDNDAADEADRMEIKRVLYLLGMGPNPDAPFRPQR
jgi:hypothetical protein